MTLLFAGSLLAAGCSSLQGPNGTVLVPAAARNQPAVSSGRLSERPVPATNGMLPPNARPGQCFARIWIPPRFETRTERVLRRAASDRVEVIPAKYRMVTKRVLAAEPAERLVVIPAKYKTVTEKVMVKPETRRLVTVPAEYEYKTEKVLVKEGYTTWKKGKGPIQRIDESTGEIMCLVEVPPVYKTVTKKVVKRPATTKEIVEPAVYKTVTKRVVAEPAQTRVVKIPAKYRTIQVRELVEPARERRIHIPAEYQTVTRQVKVEDGYMAWAEILCETNMTPSRVTAIQRALKARGYDPGPITGRVTPQMMQAVNAYQRDNGLNVTKYLTIATVESLGVSPR